MACRINPDSRSRRRCKFLSSGMRVMVLRRFSAEACGRGLVTTTVKGMDKDRVTVLEVMVQDMAELVEALDPPMLREDTAAMVPLVLLMVMDIPEVQVAAAAPLVDLLVAPVSAWASCSQA